MVGGQGTRVTHLRNKKQMCRTFGEIQHETASENAQIQNKRANEIERRVARKHYSDPQSWELLLVFAVDRMRSARVRAGVYGSRGGASIVSANLQKPAHLSLPESVPRAGREPGSARVFTQNSRTLSRSYFCFLKLALGFFQSSLSTPSPPDLIRCISEEIQAASVELNRCAARLFQPHNLHRWITILSWITRERLERGLFSAGSAKPRATSDWRTLVWADTHFSCTLCEPFLLLLLPSRRITRFFHVFGSPRRVCFLTPLSLHPRQRAFVFWSTTGSLSVFFVFRLCTV